MTYIIFKKINTSTSIGVSNLKYKNEKSTVSKFGNNVKDIFDDMFSNYPIIFDKGEFHECLYR